jgi:hypothetical protein
LLKGGTSQGRTKGAVDIYSSFREGHYSPSIGLERKEWEILFREFVASGVVVKSEPDGN